jgi:hypothetical protein
VHAVEELRDARRQQRFIRHPEGVEPGHPRDGDDLVAPDAQLEQVEQKV